MFYFCHRQILAAQCPPWKKRTAGSLPNNVEIFLPQIMNTMIFILLGNHHWPVISELKVYWDTNYGGRFWGIGESLSYIGSTWNDQISSVKAIGGAWQLYEHIGYDTMIVTLCEGEKRSLTGDLGDKITSVKFISPPPADCTGEWAYICMYSEINYFLYIKW